MNLPQCPSPIVPHKRFASNAFLVQVPLIACSGATIVMFERAAGRSVA